LLKESQKREKNEKAFRDLGSGLIMKKIL